MKKQDLIKANIQPKGIYNLRYIEQETGLRKLKLYEFVKGKTNLSDAEATTVLSFIKNATKLQR